MNSTQASALAQAISPAVKAVADALREYRLFETRDEQPRATVTNERIAAHPKPNGIVTEIAGTVYFRHNGRCYYTSDKALVNRILQMI